MHFSQDNELFNKSKKKKNVGIKSLTIEHSLKAAQKKEMTFSINRRHQSGEIIDIISETLRKNICTG